ncbi:MULTISPECIES: MotA/TolQ/ExbB proton channel family protein [unclassified Colwellia]|uniref:MotA/TolQ/ExbB proton channel family protein n=1 Tax=unclassified Colwellia TaxID=196834 RepID=UPI0015F35F32|nr:MULTISPECIES: MotA/TolQ/ExbB proton channel family protein [unclassified Colwellia]MBA6290319.1 MotA/TolQ/ExbB proton channel family protein [Colwellia sp. MB3u-4]MBA6295258.1 MotA/TolQ/ExbB proton channel family protein [Colwellia sp. MB02u-9]
MIALIEQTMYQLSDFFMAPVLCLIALLFIYALFASGQFFSQTLQRRRHYKSFIELLNSQLGHKPELTLNGYPMASLANEIPNISQDQLDVAALKELEGVRNVSRLAPMLGLIATMIPMGPALKSLADGNIQGISENLIVAFSAVIFGLIIASITFWIASVKKRWMVEELVALMPLINPKPYDDVRQELALPVHAVEKDYEVA